MLLYRVFPYLPTAEEGAPGHPLYVHPGQGKGRWDNPDLYRLRYVALTPEAAVGETFGNLARWSPDMLTVPFLPGAERQLATYSMDETIHPLLDFDDANTLVDRGLRPTQVVGRNRPLTTGIAAKVFREGRWAGVRWWSYHRPQWTLAALWIADDITVEAVEPVTGHPALEDAARSRPVWRDGI